MKMIKMALLGGVALAVTTAAARADDLSALKAQIESLNARVAQMEAAPAVPAGYNMLAISEAQATVVPGMTREEQASFAGEANVVSVLPTADAPAAATVEWNGFARAIIGYVNRDEDAAGGAGDSEDVSIYGRGRLNVTAKTDTAVGEIGVRMRFEGNGEIIDGDYAVENEIAWGWWAMTPELTLGGGYNGSVGSIGFGYDGACTCHFIDNANVYELEGDATQMRLSYASGPMSAAIAIEDGTGVNALGNLNGELSAGGESPIRVAGEIAYAGDSFSGEISGLMVNADGDDGYNIGAGIGFSLGDIATISMAGGVGNTVDSNGTLPNDLDYYFVNALASMNLSDEVHAEFGAGWKDYEGDYTVLGIMSGIYYQPVDQLTIGLEAEYVQGDSDIAGVNDVDTIFAGLVTMYSF